MTEKDYSGATTAKIGKNAASAMSNSKLKSDIIKRAGTEKEKKVQKSSSTSNIESYKKAGQIASKTREYAKQIIKPNMLLSEIAEKIEAEIVKLGGQVAFPVNLSIDHIAAHYTPTLNDETQATGLLKVDIGVHIEGYIADLAFSIDLTQEKKYEKQIKTSELALKAALELVKQHKEKTKIGEIGKIINKKITELGFSPIVNLSGHGLDQYDIHSGITIPNIDNGNEKEIGEGSFAIEPFVTPSSADGSVYDGAGSNIFRITGNGQVRDNFSREVLEFILDNKKTLPFSKRELERKFGSRAAIAVANLKRAGIIDEFPQLVEKSHQVVAQTEASFIISSSGVEIITE